jgi:predicted pyridoxine 5'-phosphate oxidase superfamily flavin-nucleotide-binding protein
LEVVVSESPFHAGEAEMQARAGVRERLEQLGPRVIRDFMPHQHRELFGKLPILIVGSLDAGGRPWASLLVGQPGFIASPDERTLRVSAAPARGDPVRANLHPNGPIGLLGIELATRRRNRANGTVTASNHNGFEVHIEQSFGNCAQYIQARTPEFVADPLEANASDEPRTEGRELSARAVALDERADTFFIATAAANARGGDAVHGCDVSHRGGNPGFVRVERAPGASLLYWPDFRGNFFFNTLGNLASSPRAGLLFLDFDAGDVLMLTGAANVIWDGPLVASFVGAERMIKFVPEEGLWVRAAAALRWSAPEFARQLAATGP